MCFPCFQYIKVSHDWPLERIGTARSFTVFVLTRMKWGNSFTSLFLDRTVFHKGNLSVLSPLTYSVQLTALTFGIFPLLFLFWQRFISLYATPPSSPLPLPSEEITFTHTPTIFPQVEVLYQLLQFHLSRSTSWLRCYRDTSPLPDLPLHFAGF